MAKRKSEPDGPNPFGIPPDGAGAATATAPPPPPAAAAPAGAAPPPADEGDDDDGEGEGEAAGASGGNGAAPKKTQASAMERIGRILAKRIKDLEAATDVDPAARELALDGLRGLKALVDTREQLGDPANRPGPDTAWGRVIAYGKAKARAYSIL